MRLLLASTGLSALVIATTAAAQTTIDTKRTTAIATSSAKAGAPDDVRITSAGSVTPAAGTAVLLDSANKVTNEGTIQVTNADNATGIAAIANGAGTITNAAAGKITIDESYEPVDTDKDGDLDGPFATGTGRAGIRTLGAFTGSVINNGAVTVEGNDDAGIALGGRLTGNLTTDGTISVTGDRSVGVRAGDVAGSVRIAGSVTARGRDATAVAIGGDITGALVVQGSIAATGYRSTTPPTDVSKLDGDDLLQGGPALSIAGNVTGGVILAVPPRDTDSKSTDDDKDSIEDAKEGSAAVVSYGSAAAVQVGAATRAITLESIAGNSLGFGLVIDGGVSGQGTYRGVAGNGLVIGGQGGAVAIAGGLAVNGTVQALATGANATALRIGAGASVPEVRVAGTLNAAGGGSAGNQATALQIDAGASVTTVRNSGTIKATAAGNDGSATAIIDRSGTVTLIENSGGIAATGALASSTRNVAIDLGANTSGATIRQTVSGAAIQGDILLGAGNDNLEVRGGTVTGNVRFGQGRNSFTLAGSGYTGQATFGSGADAVALSGNSVFVGGLDFGGGADTMFLSDQARFSGTLANAGGLALTVTGGLLNVTSTGPVAIGSLYVGSRGALGVTLDTATRTATRYQVAGSAIFDKGAQIAVTLSGIKNAEGRYTLISAGTLTGASNLSTTDVLLPFLYTSALATGTPANEIALDIKRKTAVQLGLNRSGATPFGAIYAALGQDEKVGNAVLAINDGEAFRATVRQFLPDHAGGVFEAVTSGSRAVARMLADGGAPYASKGKLAYWLSPVGYSATKKIGDTAGYDVSGFGGAGGLEAKTKLGGLGVSLGYLRSKVDDDGTANKVDVDQFEVGAYWRGEWGGLRPFARASAAYLKLDSSRSFMGAVGNEPVARTSRADWDGKLYSASGGVSYEGAVGHLTFRPIATLDWYRLTEDAHDEAGGGKAFDLTVGRRVSDEFAGTAAMNVGLAFGEQEYGWFHIEAEGGRRAILGGGLGTTRGQYAGGQAFTLVPEARTDGWVGRLRAVGGNNLFRLGGEVSAEERYNRAALALRVSLQVGM
ncbi:autotransporter outer membrane beta-barrel domain-containing protein [Sphingomonas aerophila]|uniref:Uncharacterized protein with beta-barrel porin domain n=1 Tax=Sphingomonas aerophila TaxID=1344948 RepID=A0A7W9EWJ2_9SPHN|nr:autotransporter outer membrane beta-barrel domain-containing protein [Sphingomonas aerophila]MBB5715598.1 uncharacterized protein with beta-barrel porin domain [Sphingomonas aerophila]